MELHFFLTESKLFVMLRWDVDKGFDTDWSLSLVVKLVFIISRGLCEVFVKFLMIFQGNFIFSSGPHRLNQVKFCIIKGDGEGYEIGITLNDLFNFTSSSKLSTIWLQEYIYSCSSRKS